MALVELQLPPTDEQWLSRAREARWVGMARSASYCYH